MAKPRHLSKAPITEAVIDFRCSLPADFDLERLKLLSKEDGYPECKAMRMFEFEMGQEGDKAPESRHFDQVLIGWRYLSSDGLQIAQLRKDGFTFSRLAPYTDWDAIFAEASRIYRLYHAAAFPEEVNRVAVRYINRLPLPENEVGDFSLFLTFPPAFASERPVLLSGFLNQVQVTDPVSGISATVTQTIQPGGGQPGVLPLILDLDVYERGTLPADPETILGRFGALRETKNRYFFGSITEKTASLFE